MPILFDDIPRVIIQGVTGRYGDYYTKRMIDYGTNVVGGVTPGKGGEWFENRPIFDSVVRAVEATGANTSMVVVPSTFATDALFEAINGGIKTIICLTEHMPIQDVMRVAHYAQSKGVTLIGPNSAGVLLPSSVLIGMIPANAGVVGNIGVVAKSGTLLYEVGLILTKLRLGQTALVSIGSDPIVGTTLLDMLEVFESDPHTERIVMLGEIGGRDEMLAAEYIRDEMTKPVIAMIAGRNLPVQTRVGHAGAIIDGLGTSAEEKQDALLSAGARIAIYPEQIPELLLNLD